MKEKLFTQKDVADMFGVQVNTIRRWRKEKKIPEPIKLTYKTLVWRARDIKNLLNDYEMDQKDRN